MIYKDKLLKTISNHNSLRGVKPLTLSCEDIDLCVGGIIKNTKDVVLTKNANDFQNTWISRKMMNKQHINRHTKPIPRMKTVIDYIVNHMQLEIRHTVNTGPSYTYHEYITKPNPDWVCMPEIDRFSESKYYYKILLHEIAHAVCAKTRLDIKSNESEEEVIVELSSLIICFIAGLNVWDNSLAYIVNWSYGSANICEDHILCFQTPEQWYNIQSKTTRIVKYLLTSIDYM